MIYLTKGQPLLDNPNLVVYDSTGYYNDGDTVICAPVGLPEEPACRFEAKYILYGGIVYSITDPELLMAEILKLDPASLYGKDSQQLAADKVIQEIVPQESGQVTEDATTEVVDPNTETAPLIDEGTTTEATSSTPVITEEVSTTTPDVAPSEPLPLTNPTSTPPIEIIETSTTTAPVIDDAINTLTSTSTDPLTP